MVCERDRASSNSTRRPRRWDSFEGTIKADQATIENANLQLGFTKVTAPITGRIGLRQVDAGNIVHATDTTASS